MNTLRITRPKSVRTGMFCRLGSAEEMRPVAVTVWLSVVWMIPSSSESLSSPSTYVDLSLEKARYCKTSGTTGCACTSPSSTSASVE